MRLLSGIVIVEGVSIINILRISYAFVQICVAI